MPIGIPGWPESAFCTASMARPRIVLAVSCSESVATVMAGLYRRRCSGGTAPRRLPGRSAWRVPGDLCTSGRRPFGAPRASLLARLRRAGMRRDARDRQVAWLAAHRDPLERRDPRVVAAGAAGRVAGTGEFAREVAELDGIVPRWSSGRAPARPRTCPWRSPR